MVRLVKTIRTWERERYFTGAASSVGVTTTDGTTSLFSTVSSLFKGFSFSISKLSTRVTLWGSWLFWMSISKTKDRYEKEKKVESGRTIVLFNGSSKNIWKRVYSYQNPFCIIEWVKLQWVTWFLYIRKEIIKMCCRKDEIKP